MTDLCSFESIAASPKSSAAASEIFPMDRYSALSGRFQMRETGASRAEPGEALPVISPFRAGWHRLKPSSEGKPVVGANMKILLPVDGSEYGRAAVEFVASRSTLIGTDPQVDVVNVQLEVPVRAARVVGKNALTDYYSDESDKVLKPALRRLAKSGLTASARYLVGHPGEQIGLAAMKDKVDLIVMGSHGHSALRNLLVGSVTNNVLARTQVPMLVVRKKEAPTTDSLKVGIAVDGSKFGREAVKFVLRHRALFGSKPEITLLHVVSDFAGAVMPDMGGIALPAYSAAEVRAIQQRAFETCIAPARKLLDKAGVKAGEVCLVGSPGDELSAYARKKRLGVLVMGSHGYGAFKAAVLGSVATRVMAHSSVPVLLVRHA
jgi:nucleotide-binding universal stress UspA family protein